MKIYLVGGAVRDQLLNIPVKDRDYLVVGSTPQEMLDLGFKPIGKDFPVFLHPKTKNEYALARTEKKVGIGHKGFIFHASPDITIEEDLERRDITINAIAMDESNNYIDPYGGMKDLKYKVIRHVSSAFQEDPLRVMRVARFYAKLDSFSIHKDTSDLMQKVVTKGEIQNLSAERIMNELHKGFEEENAFNMLAVLNDSGALSIIFPEIAFEKNREGIKKVLHLSNRSSENSKQRRLLLFLLTANFNHNKIDTKIYDNISKILLPSSEKKIISLIEKFINELVTFFSLEQSDQLDCLYNFDFFRRPQLFYEAIEILSLVLESNGSNLESITLSEKFVKSYQKLVNNHQNIIDPTFSGDEIKLSIYNDRLMLLKKLK